MQIVTSQQEIVTSQQEIEQNENLYREIEIVNPETGEKTLCYFHVPTEYSRYCARKNLEYLQKELKELCSQE